MKRLIVILLLLLMFAAPTFTEARQPGRLSLLLSTDWRQKPREARLVGWFQHHRVLKTVKATVYKGRECAAAVLPCVRLQRSDGYVIYQASGENIPETADKLAEGLVFPGTRHLLHWRRQAPTPGPAPVIVDPPPFESRDVRELERVPDTVLPAKEEAEVEVVEEGGFPWLIVLLGMLGGGGSLAYNVRKEF